MSASVRPGQSKSLFAVLATVLVALLVAGGVWWFFENYRKVSHTIELSPRGEASYNPLYALKLTLRDAGRKVVSRQRLELSKHPMQATDTLLMMSDPRTLSADDSKALLDWVESGGHLILTTPTPGVEIGDADVPILTELGIAPYDDAPECMGLRVAKHDGHVELCNGRRFYFYDEDVATDAAWFEENEDGRDYGYARVPLGEGSVDLIAELDFLQNDKLDDDTHIALARQLLQPNWGRGGTFHLVYSSDMPPFWKLLYDYGWRALLPLFVALLVWLWMRAERVGPQQPAPTMDRRSLLEHVQASGEHLYRYGRRATLYAAVYDAFMRRLRQRDPYAAALEGPAQIEALAKRTGLSIHDVEAALRYPRSGDRKDFVFRIARLLQLRRRL